MLGRFCRLLSILLYRKIPLNISLVLVRDTLTFVPIQEAVALLAAQVDKGVSLSEALKQSRLFPATLPQFVLGAEMHAELPQTLARLSELYEQRSEFQGTQVRLALFVLAQLVIGLCVFAMIVSLFWPIYRIQDAMRIR